jgi:hypothetical protein
MIGSDPNDPGRDASDCVDHDGGRDQEEAVHLIPLQRVQMRRALRPRRGRRGEVLRSAGVSKAAARAAEMADQEGTRRSD